MSSQVSLTRPISVTSRAGTTLPWERPYSTEPIATLTHNGANLFHIDMSPSASTRILSARIGDAAQPSLRELDPALLLNRRTSVVRVAPRGTEIAADELARALDDAALERAAALLLLTGWGDGITDENPEDAPHLSIEAVEVLCGALEAHDIDLVLTDLPYLTAPGGRNAGADWLSVAPWFRPSWPSSSSAAYLGRHYTRGHVLEDWKPTLDLLERSLLVLGVVNGDAVTTQNVVINVAPFQVRDVGEAPCTVVAQAADHQ
jgi:kynurenine formamidase